MSTPTFTPFRSRLEGPHGTIHGWVGRPNGSMWAMTSPNDLIFFLHHSNVDRLWSKWQESHPGVSNYNPRPSIGLTPYGHNIDDRMWPWDGVNPIAGL